MSYKTKLDEDDGFGDPIPVCREYTLPRANPLSRAYAAIPGETINWKEQSLKLTSYTFLAPMDLKSKFHLQVIQNGRLGFWYPKERVDSWTNRISQNVRHNLTSAELLSEQENAKERKLCLAKSKTGTQETGAASDPSSRKLDADPVSFSLSPVYYTKRTTPTKERKWKLIPAHSSYIGGSLSTAISKKVTRLVRHYDQEERQSDAAVHWDTTRPKLLRAFADRGARDFSETDWLRHIHDVSNKTRFEHCEGSKKSLTSLRAIQGHTGGITIAPELMGTLWFLTIGKSLCFTGVVPSTSTPSLRMDSLQEENRASRRRQTIFFTPPNPFWWKCRWRSTQWWLHNSQESALSQQLETYQDAVYWVKLTEHKIKDCDSGRRNQVQ